MLCTFWNSSHWCCAHYPSLTIRIDMLSMYYPRMDSVSFLWRTAYSQCFNYFDDRCSEYSTLMPSIAVQTTELPCRGEWYSQTTSWFNVTTPIVVSLFRSCDPVKLITIVVGFVRLHYARRIQLHGWRCTGDIGRWAIHLCDIGRWAIHLCDIDLTEISCKSSSSLGYMPCINDPERCWYFFLLSFWPL
jgi:hypothetical protein